MLRDSRKHLYKQQNDPTKIPLSENLYIRLYSTK